MTDVKELKERDLISCIETGNVEKATKELGY